MSVAETLRRNTKITSTTSTERQQQRHLHVVHRGAHRLRAVVERRRASIAAGICAAKRRQDASGSRRRRRSCSCPAAAESPSMIAARPVEPRGDLVVLDAVEHPADIVEAHRRAVAIGDDQRRVAVALSSCPLACTVIACCGPLSVPVGRLTLRCRPPAHLVEPMPRARQRIRIELDAHRVLLRSVDLHLRHAGQRRDALRQQRLGVLVDLRHRQRRRRQREDQDRRIGGIDLAQRRRRRHRRRQRPRGGGDRRLHVLRRGVDVAIERELQRDRRRARRRWSRSSSRRRRWSRTVFPAASRPPWPSSPGSRRAATPSPRWSGKSTLGSSETGSSRYAITPKNEEADHQQRGHHRPADERFGDVHEALAARPSVTLAPGERRSWPTVTTCSPAARPLATTVSSPSARATLMLRSSTVRSGLTT